ncbi:uncharacterized protein LOC111330874 [Stylophora pistillata]|nr:uncharacterized protein LOC111330874 [Stylophora pistillata]
MGYVQQRTSYQIYLLLFILVFVSFIFSFIYIQYYPLIVPMKKGSPSFVTRLEVDISHRSRSTTSIERATHFMVNGKGSQRNIDDLSYSGKSVPLMDFKDLRGRKERVLLLVTVGSAPQRFDRRQAIRDTWWKYCNQKKVKCVFFTDGIIKNQTLLTLLLQEKNSYKDLELQPLPAGVQFGQRFLNSIKWATAKFDFNYLLKLDDDYLICLNRLLFELPLRPKRNLVWGHFHCEVEMTWADEAFVIFSADMIRKFLAQDKNKILCHPFADQQYSIWMKHMTKLYFHDTRLHHDPPASFIPEFREMRNLCDWYIGIHGTYVDEMRKFAKVANDGAKEIDTIPKFSTFCPFKNFDHRRFSRKYHFHPKPCIRNPTWKGSKFTGREDESSLREKDQQDE